MEDEIRIDAGRCFRCDKAFTLQVKKTKHHAIPSSMKPKRNLTVPCCEDCHQEIHQTLTITPKLKEFENFIRGMEEFVKKHKKKLERIPN